MKSNRGLRVFITPIIQKDMTGTKKSVNQNDFTEK